MTQEPDKLINLSVHESADPSQISSHPDLEASGKELNDLNDSVHDDENVDNPTPKPVDISNHEDAMPDQTMIANISAG